ncbi:MAG TPA: LemA family protein [Chryseosolibacter sp.]
MRMKQARTLRSFISASVVASTCFLALCSCDKKEKPGASFSKADSLTETFLTLQDSMVASWNAMISDDDTKIKAMHHLLHQLSVLNPASRDELKVFEGRVDGLVSLRYDQRTMSDTEIVSEYDFASNALVSELVSLAESQPEFTSDKALQKLVDDIRDADLRVDNYRDEYDANASRLNQFIEENGIYLKATEEKSFLEKRPLFQMASDP